MKTFVITKRTNNQREFYAFPGRFVTEKERALAFNCFPLLHLENVRKAQKDANIYFEEFAEQED